MNKIKKLGIGTIIFLVIGIICFFTYCAIKQIKWWNYLLSPTAYLVYALLIILLGIIISLIFYSKMKR